MGWLCVLLTKVCTRLLNMCCLQTGEIRQPNAPLARDPWACRRLLDASLLILKEVDPQLADNKWAQISPDGKVWSISLYKPWPSASSILVGKLAC